MPGFVNYKKGCPRLAATSDNVYQLLSQGRWFSPGTLSSSTTKTGRHDIDEILLKVALNNKIQIHFKIQSKGTAEFLLFNATSNNISAISWRAVLVVEEAGVPGENHRPWANNW